MSARRARWKKTSAEASLEAALTLLQSVFEAGALDAGVFEAGVFDAGAAEP
jgi:hypothetical protein